MNTPSGSSDLHLNTGAMALDALPDDERALFFDHLTDCETCAPELAGFSETLGRLSVLTEQAPPASLRASVLAAVAVTAQLPPVVAERGRHRVEADATVSSEEPESAIAPVVPLRRPWYSRPTTLLAAVVVAIALAVAGVVLTNRNATGPDAYAAMESCVATAADAQLLTPAVGAGGNVRYAPSCGAATVTMPPVPEAPQGMGYQLWVLNGADAEPMGMVTMGEAGTPAPMTFEVTMPATDIGVSMEPAAGSATPTSDPIWVVHLPS